MKLPQAMSSTTAKASLKRRLTFALNADCLWRHSTQPRFRGCGRGSFSTGQRYRSQSPGKKPLTVREFSKEFDAAAQIVGLSPDLMKRSLNEGFSGGEKKRNEVLQMLVLKPAFCILDETDSGLDVDALKLVGESVNSIRSDQNAFLVVTHYNRVLKHIKPDVVHILRDGRIVKTGDPKLALEIEEHGYEILNRD